MNNQFDEMLKPAIDTAIAYAENNSNLTDTQKDVVDTWKELNKYPFDRNSAEQRILMNNSKHWEYAASVDLSPNHAPVMQLSDNDLIFNLQNQLIYLVCKCIKENH